jgi:hypothetical protein
MTAAYDVWVAEGQVWRRCCQCGASILHPMASHGEVATDRSTDGAFLYTCFAHFKLVLAVHGLGGYRIGPEGVLVYGRCKEV